ncbi:MAG: NAD-glutamate dehydrogenase [Rhizobiales bacterium]|nr:NAD-glutamate dehydrogenase [Hyphomicrobiales bacterium]
MRATKPGPPWEEWVMLEGILGLLGTRDGGGPAGMTTFVSQFIQSLGRGALESYAEKAGATLIESALRHIEHMPADGRSIATENHTLLRTGGQPASEMTVVNVLNRDKPFLVDSIVAELLSHDIAAELIAHPILKTERDGEGKLTRIAGPGNQQWQEHQESLIQLVVPRLPGELASKLVSGIERVLEDIDRVVGDWGRMRERVAEVAALYEQPVPGVAAADLEEARAFLIWLVDNNFTFLGVRRYRLLGGLEAGEVEVEATEGLGILGDPALRVLRRGKEFVEVTQELRRFYAGPAPLIINKANAVATIHRRMHMDYIGTKLYAADGSVSGELRIVGLFTSTAYTQSVYRIPILRTRAKHVADTLGYPPESHSGKALANVLETFPRDELFQIEQGTLVEWATGILDLGLRPRTRVFVRIDEFDRFVSVLVFAPRDRYTTEARERIAKHLAEVYQGRLSAFNPSFGQGPLVRVQFIIGRYEGRTPRIQTSDLEAQVAAILRDWSDELGEEIAVSPAARAIGPAFALKFRDAFSVGYKSDFGPKRALYDAIRIEPLDDANPIAIDIYRRAEQPANEARVALYRIDRSIPLSRRVPFFENLGFDVIDERSYTLRPTYPDGPREVRLHDMRLEDPTGNPVELAAQKGALEETFHAVWSGRAEDDHFNRLVRATGAGWREAMVARAYAAYMRQIRLAFGQRYISDTLVRHPEVTRRITELFALRHDPDNGLDLEARRAEETVLVGTLEDLLEKVENADEDRILRHYVNLVRSTVRTNFYRRDANGQPPETFAFKLDSRIVDGMPEPKPYREIFVYSPRVEGIHLRGGPVARGGIRWSDRPQDFRSEVLGLAKAQQVKNAVIVPAGAKGGFIPKQLPRSGNRDEVYAEGVAAYTIFVSSLLDITDNLEGETIIPPERVVRHDGNDPYLVVAADKGTARFSDTANAISGRHDFWLGDAFASGGSAGYDHKAMAITARGGWEAVKRHFREMNRDIQTSPFTVVGIGDMSGDVFGNGMLLSRQTRLLAAFDHRDIFIDPDPDAERSFSERERIFALARSSWQDYDRNLISTGGGVFSRNAKAIPLSAEMKALTGLSGASATPSQVMHALLKADVDLIWFGGIGTFVKSEDESDADVNDRANDAVRVNGREIRAKVIGEGANLGVTQLGRVEFAQHGGRINTDAIDNSAGVNSSDQEVNIKIALRPAVRAGAITMEERNALLVEMTEDVANACLRNNYLQTLALSLGERRGLQDLGFQERLMRQLEANGLLDRTIEQLPDTATVARRAEANLPLTRPELAVLLGYAKIDLFAKLVASKVPDDPFLENVLLQYFPERMREAHRGGILGHRLRRDIIATTLTNDVINRGGSTMVVRLVEETGENLDEIVYAFVAVAEVFDLGDLWRRIDALDNKVGGQLQLDLYLEVQHVLRQRCAWFMAHHDFARGLGDTIASYRDGIAAYGATLASDSDSAQARGRAARIEELVGQGVAPDVARDVTGLAALAEGLDAVLVARTRGLEVGAVAPTYLTIGERLRLGELRSRVGELTITDHFDRLAINSTMSGIAETHRALTGHVLSLAESAGAEAFESWQETSATRLAKARASLDEILAGQRLTVAQLAVAAAQVRDLLPKMGA